MNKENTNKLTVDELQELHKKMVMIDGKGKSWIQIVENYQRHIESGFDVTIEELTMYFGCQAAFIERLLRPEFRHIVISSTVRKFIKKAIAEAEISGNIDWKPLITKRLLFLRADVNDYIQSLSTRISFGYVEWSDLKENYTFASIERKYANKEKMVSVLSTAAEELYGQPIEIEKSLERVPKKMYSLQELKTMNNQKHNVETYRWLARMGANKILVHGLVRYDCDEFMDKAVPVPIQAFQNRSVNEIVEELIEFVSRDER